LPAAWRATSSPSTPCAAVLRAAQYGFVNRAIADDQLDDEVDTIATRLARFDRDAIARTKSYVDRVTLPADSELCTRIRRFL
jgi:enoyl-CoA hydratase/carnithine racemase